MTMREDMVRDMAVAIVNGDWEALPELHKVLALAQARKALSALEAMGCVVQTWQRIESAPRDGTPILVWTTTREPHYDDQQYIKSICQGVHVEGVQPARWIEEDGEWEMHYIGTPLFWMPLPTPPVAAASPLPAQGRG